MKAIEGGNEPGTLKELYKGNIVGIIVYCLKERERWGGLDRLESEGKRERELCWGDEGKEGKKADGDG